MPSKIFDNLKIEEVSSKENPYSSSFVFRHLPSGMGVTLGNFLRRIIPISTGGIASLGVKIIDKEGPVKVEVGEIKGLKETTPYLIINLKKIIVKEKKKKGGIFCLELKIDNSKGKQEKIITAGDFQNDKEAEIENPELYLGTLAPSASLELKLYFQKNLGYHEDDEQKKKYFPDDEEFIPFDTDYSSIKENGGVNFQVNPVIISQDKSEEELTVFITTKGTIKPKEVLNETLGETQDLFKLITDSINKEK
ncbi:MAG: DNA-directed RNA polymerase subunit alpha [Mycoplasmataceae bacterium]|nr:MAG: DNA-directed RNA polymerase subunit alpha [Mycoplasmataceae bacterium]